MYNTGGPVTKFGEVLRHSNFDCSFQCEKYNTNQYNAINADHGIPSIHNVRCLGGVGAAHETNQFWFVHLRQGYSGIRGKTPDYPVPVIRDSQQYMTWINWWAWVECLLKDYSISLNQE